MEWVGLIFGVTSKYLLLKYPGDGERFAVARNVACCHRVNVSGIMLYGGDVSVAVTCVWSGVASACSRGSLKSV